MATFNTLMTLDAPITRAEIAALGAGLNATPGYMYRSSDAPNGVEEKAYGTSDGSVVWLTTPTTQTFQNVQDTGTLNLSLDASGELSGVVLTSTDNDSVLKTDAAGNLKVSQMQVHGDSTGFMSIVYDANGVGTIKVEELLISRPSIVPPVAQGGAADLNAYLATNYTNGNEFQMSDHIVVQETGSVYIHNGGTAGDATDFTKVNIQGYTDAAIRALFSGDNVIGYDPNTGQISFKLDPTSDGAAAVTANGLLIDASEGHITDNNGFISNVIPDPARTIQMLFDEMGAVTASAVQYFSFNGTNISDSGAIAVGSNETVFTINNTSSANSYAMNLDFDTTSAATGDALIYDGTNVVWGQQYTFANALTKDGQDITWGGDLSKTTLVRGLGQHDVVFESNFEVRGSAASPYNLNIISTQYTNPTDTNFTLLIPGYVASLSDWQVGDEVLISYTQDGITKYRLAISTALVDNAPTFDTADGQAWGSSISNATNLQAHPNTGVASDLLVSGGDIRYQKYGTKVGGLSYIEDSTGKIAVTNWTVPNTSPSENQVLKSDVNGDLQWADPVGETFDGAANGLSVVNDRVYLGGALLQDTVVEGNGHDMTWDVATYIGGVETYVNQNTLEVLSNDNAGNAVLKGNLSFAASELYVGQKMVFTGGGNGIEDTTITIGAINILNIATNEVELTFTDFNTSATIFVGAFWTFKFQENTSKDLYVSNDLYINRNSASTINNYRPAVMQDNTSGKVGFAPYTLPSTSGQSGQVLTFDANGNVVPTTLNTGTSSVVAANGLNATTSNGQVTVKMGGDMETGTTTMEGLIDAGVKVSNIVWNRINEYTVDAVDTTIYGRSSFKLHTLEAANRTNGVLQSINVDGTAEFTPYALPTVAGAAGTVLTFDANGNVVPGSVQSPLTEGTGIDIASGVIHAGGDLTAAIAYDLKTFDFSFGSTEGAATAGSLSSSIDMEFGAGVAPVLESNLGNKFRLKITEMANGSIIIGAESV